MSGLVHGAYIWLCSQPPQQQHGAADPVAGTQHFPGLLLGGLASFTGNPRSARTQVQQHPLHKC